ncbi:hypothetical protein BDN72DRAFT_334360 [Pluteus cervinus]|uniref:Uncharacterized protein n=1 Tax=Pluteus cervinus TaxID=181527 RepID=A0ACD3B3Y3_9AGAR|nr:hypothetical protein BDN72DRAFT_334360 [Pluteus cervinus]
MSADRSASRGREFTSSGRGGLGNIRQASLSRDGRPDFNPEERNVSRGREAVPSDNSERVYSTGRGGAGNLRSPSRDITKPDPVQEEVIEQYKTANKDAAHSTGRGGIGNITRSRSRGPAVSVSPGPVHSTGRGGAGNILPGDGHDSEALDEAERKKHVHAHAEGIHSTGRGGAANLTATPGPAVEHHPHGHHNDFTSTGRGGAGNITHS